MISLTIGGLGLFLLGMALMTDGLKLAGGKTLNYILETWTATRLRAFIIGFFATAIVQSSSAVTVSVIGFVNAGFLNLRQSMWTVYGSNVGTTMTAWIVAMIGLKVKVDILALPAIGLGTFIHLFATRVRWRAVGGAIAGLGLLFFGLSLMQQAFLGIADQIDLVWLNDRGLVGLVGLVFIGAALTAVMQSSSAALAVVLTAVSTGIVSLESGAAAVIGANIGTTATAILAVLNATPVAKRVASAHVIFNLLAACIALLLLGFMLTLIAAIQDQFGQEPNPVIALAIFHTLFNIAGALVMVPLSSRVADYLEEKFESGFEDLSEPVYLDKATASSPDSALRALMLEENRLLGLIRSVLVTSENDAQVEHRIESLKQLVVAIDGFIASASSKNVPVELIGVFQEISSLNLHASEVLENRSELEGFRTADLPEEARAVVANSAGYLNRLLEWNCDDMSKLDELKQLLTNFDEEYDASIEELKDHARRGVISMPEFQFSYRYLSTLRRILRQYGKSLNYFWRVSVTDTS